nr:MAG: hypothetical protein EDM05_26305 [Leptolyngbya sp. IPPAS B-1204]
MGKIGLLCRGCANKPKCSDPNEFIFDLLNLDQDDLQHLVDFYVKAIFTMYIQSDNAMKGSIPFALA